MFGTRVGKAYEWMTVKQVADQVANGLLHRPVRAVLGVLQLVLGLVSAQKRAQFEGKVGRNGDL